MKRDPVGIRLDGKWRLHHLANVIFERKLATPVRSPEIRDQHRVQTGSHQIALPTPRGDLQEHLAEIFRPAL